MIRDGDAGGGLAYAGTVLDALPAEQHTDLVYARTAVAAAPDSHRRRREVKHLTGRLALPAAPTA